MTRAVALVDDDEDLRRATAQLLTLGGFEVTAFADAVEALGAIGRSFAGPVVTDVRMPRMSGIELFRTLRDRDADLPVILMTGHGDVAMAVDALKGGAWDFLEKPFNPDVLLAAVERASTARALVLENRRLREAADSGPAAAILGEAPAIRRLRELVPVIADAQLDIVVEGETGVGKRLLARTIHRAGKRARHRFTAIDCATVPAQIVERELFARGGAIARGDRGTLFLDRIDLASPELARRLALLAESRMVALDLRDPDPVDIRIIATMPDGGRNAVNDALYHRLAGVPLRVPPLRERRGDIPILFAHHAERAAADHRRPLPRFGDLPHRLAARDWPGNVRELANQAERLVLGIDADPDGSQPADAAPLPARLDQFERAAIVEAVQASGGEIAAAIDRLGVPRKTFYYRTKRLGIDLKALRETTRSSGG
ncbi:two-component system C4-dicarboxylate transport response regulator DctD [Sphingomonas jejuensis]|uniref:Two-component system C4-dicarboxylate transport response regulator DctD n=1 Tax=Sphingomonas jejuensis TaxID=904715 RepID=A0ABX0XHL5_9SPHN|nr:sigma-54 dependent transcriptional regulator [Sphingomonas jejuensis]NJC32704.1 two-component system C4-dicarboxylate transport response regulator DctD [Sphingomonas jejuensis]